MKKYYLGIFAAFIVLFLRPSQVWAGPWNGLNGTLSSSDGVNWTVRITNESNTTDAALDLAFSAYWCNKDNATECDSDFLDYRGVDRWQTFSFTVPSVGTTSTLSFAFSELSNRGGLTCGRVQADVGPANPQPGENIGGRAKPSLGGDCATSASIASQCTTGPGLSLTWDAGYNEDSRCQVKLTAGTDMYTVSNLCSSSLSGSAFTDINDSSRTLTIQDTGTYRLTAGETDGGTTTVDCTILNPYRCNISPDIPTTPNSATVTVEELNNDGSWNTTDWKLYRVSDDSLLIQETNNSLTRQFTGLTTGARYRVEAVRKNSSSEANCGSQEFTLGCTLTAASGADTASSAGTDQGIAISDGDYVTWGISANPQGNSALWKGTNPDGSSLSGPVGGYPPSPWSRTYGPYRLSGSVCQQTLTRYTEIKDGSGGTICSTGDKQISLEVRSSNPSCGSCPNNLSIDPTALLFSKLAATTFEPSSAALTASSNDGSVTWSITTGQSIVSFASGTQSSTATGQSVSVYPTGVGSARIVATDAGTTTAPRCGAQSVEIIATVTDITLPACAGFCSNSSSPRSNIVGPGGTAYDCTAGAYDALNTTSCGPQYCWTGCTTKSADLSPHPDPAPIIDSIYTTGPLLVGKILQDVNSSFNIDSPDTIISKLSSYLQSQLSVNRWGSGCRCSVVSGSPPSCCRDNEACHKIQLEKFGRSDMGNRGGPVNMCTPCGISSSTWQILNCTPGDTPVALNIVTGLPNILRGDPVYRMTKEGVNPFLRSHEINQDSYSWQQSLVYGGGISSSNSIEDRSSGYNTNQIINAYYGRSGGYTNIHREFNPNTPAFGINRTVVGSSTSSYSPSGSTSSYGNSVLSFGGGGGTTGGSCINGCALRSQVNYNVSSLPQEGPPLRCSDQGRFYNCSCSSYTYSDGRYSYTNVIDNFCSGNYCKFQNYSSRSYYCSSCGGTLIYENCSLSGFDKSQYSISPWSVSFTSAQIVGEADVSTDNWRNKFNIQDPGGCIYSRYGVCTGDRYSGNYSCTPAGYSVSNAAARPYCSCNIERWCDDCEGTQYFSCTYPLKTGEKLSTSPPGEYLFEIPVNSTAGFNPTDGASSAAAFPIRYRISLSGGSELASAEVTPADGKISVKFAVPSSGVDQRVRIELNQVGTDPQLVGLGAPRLSPIGWYEANVQFGRTVSGSLFDAHVEDPPEDYPYTMGLVPGGGSGGPQNYCSRNAPNIETCYKSISPPRLSSYAVNRIDALLGSPKADPWFQVKDMDLYTGGSLISRIPSQCSGGGCTREFDLRGSGGYPGIPVYAGLRAEFGLGTKVSDKEWIAKTGYTGRMYDYNTLKSEISQGSFVNLNDAGITDTLAASELVSRAGTGGQTQYLLYTGNLTLSGDADLADKRVVLFVEGNLAVNGKINLTDDSGGFFGAFVSGNINVSRDLLVSVPSGRTSNPNASDFVLEGVFFADGAINTGTKNPNSGDATPDGQLYIRGVLAGKNSVNLERDLDPLKQTGANNDKPAEFIEYAPDLVLNFPKELLRQGSVWREVAP